MTCDNCIHTNVCKYFPIEIAKCSDFEEKRTHSEWISCYDRLPEENDKYIVWDEYIEDDYDCAMYRISRFHNGTWLDYKGKIVAWMPLPNPYEKEGDEE